MLPPFEPKAVQRIADVGIGLRNALRMIGGGIGNDQIEGNREHYRSFGSSRIAANR